RTLASTTSVGTYFCIPALTAGESAFMALGSSRRRTATAPWRSSLTASDMTCSFNSPNANSTGRENVAPVLVRHSPTRSHHVAFDHLPQQATVCGRVCDEAPPIIEASEQNGVSRPFPVVHDSIGLHAGGPIGHFGDGRPVVAIDLALIERGVLW